jgi:R3H domain
VVVIDEIGTAAEAMAARTIAERGVQLIATAHGNTLENLLQNPTLSDLVGGIHTVTLSDEEARRRGTQKTVLERKAPPTFGVLIEILDKERLAVHHDVADVVDRLLREVPARPQLRTRTAAGEVEIQQPSEAESAPRRPDTAERGFAVMAAAGGRDERLRPPRKLVRIHPYAVSKAKLERAIRKLRAPALIVEDLERADLVLTLKAQERRQPRRLRDAQARGIPAAIVRSNTILQIENTLRAALRLGDPGDVNDLKALDAADEAAVQEAEAGIGEALDLGEPVELPPRNTYLRRLQHQAAERHGVASESKGEGSYRRVVIYPA